MSNPSKAKGTAFENEVLDLLRTVWPGADRAKAGNESCDFAGTGDWVFEAKHRKSWDLKGWVRKIRAVAGDRPWAIFASDGDRRRAESIGDLVILPRETFIELLDDQQTAEDYAEQARQGHLLREYGP